MIAPTGVDAALQGDELWLSGRDPFDERLRGLPSVMRRVPADDDREELIAVPGTVDRLSSGPHTLWGRLDERSAERAFGSLVAIGEDRAVQRTSLTELEVGAHLPPPPPTIEARPTEEKVRNRLARSLFGGRRSARPKAGKESRRPYIRGVTIEDVRLERSFPNTRVVVLFRAEQRPGVLFGRRRRIWEDSGELSDVIDVMDVNLMEDVEACGYGLPVEPHVGPEGISWF
jgi:hypothetical protein